MTELKSFSPNDCDGQTICTLGQAVKIAVIIVHSKEIQV